MKSENLGAFYKYINKRTSYRPAIGTLTDDGGNIKTDDYDKAELFNSYFATVGVVDNGTRSSAIVERPCNASCC